LLRVLLLARGCHAIQLGWREARASPVASVAWWFLVPEALIFLVSVVQPMCLARRLPAGLTCCPQLTI
jgi:hypothetical protein